MKLLNAFKTILLTTSLTLVCQSGVAATGEGGVGPGGGDPIEGSFLLARSTLTSILNESDNKDFVKLSQASRLFLESQDRNFLSELRCSPLIFDHKSTEPFIQKNGSKTWIQTNSHQPCAPIEIRTNISGLKPNFDSQYILSFYAHEIGHHLDFQYQNLSTEEEKAWLASSALIELYRAKIRYPELIGVSGEYTALAAQNECRNKASVVANPISGVITIETYTEGNTCPLFVYSSFGTAVFKFDSITKKMTTIEPTSYKESYYTSGTEARIMDTNNFYILLKLDSTEVTPHSQNNKFYEFSRSFTKVKK